MSVSFAAVATLLLMVARLHRASQVYYTRRRTFLGGSGTERGIGYKTLADKSVGGKA